MTAEEFIKEKLYITQDGIEDVHDSLSTVTDVMIEFAKLHVEAALKEASEKVVMYDANKDGHIVDEDGNFPDVYMIDRNSILNSYSLENIK